MTVNMLIQIDKLVQLLESPVFTCRFSQFFARFSLTLRFETFDFSSWSQRNFHICTNVSMVSSCSCHSHQPSPR